MYRYYGSVTAGVIEPTPYASQFALEGDLHVTHDDSDTNLNNAFYAVLSNAMTGMHNGVATDYQRKKVLTPIDQAAKAIEQPFLIVYDDNGIVSNSTKSYTLFSFNLKGNFVKHFFNSSHFEIIEVLEK